MNWRMKGVGSRKEGLCVCMHIVGSRTTVELTVAGQLMLNRPPSVRRIDRQVKYCARLLDSRGGGGVVWRQRTAGGWRYRRYKPSFAFGLVTQALFIIEPFCQSLVCTASEAAVGRLLDGHRYRVNKHDTFHPPSLAVIALLLFHGYARARTQSSGLGSDDLIN